MSNYYFKRYFNFNLPYGRRGKVEAGSILVFILSLSFMHKFYKIIVNMSSKLIMF